MECCFKGCVEVFECGFEVDLCEVLRLFEGYFEVVSSVALRVVLSVVLRLFGGCFEVLSSVAMRVVLKVVLRLYGMLL